MKSMLENIFGFLYTLSMGDYIFFISAFILILGLVYIMFLLKRDDMGVYFKEDDTDLEVLKETIEKEYKPSSVKLTDYEEEQERNAIISYQELIKSKDKVNISYDDEYVSPNDEISVKKINISDEVKNEVKNEEIKVTLMSYDKEEAFLTALKQLQQNLSN